MKNKLKIPTLILFSELYAQVLFSILSQKIERFFFCAMVLLNNIILDRTTYCTHTHQVTEKLGGGALPYLEVRYVRLLRGHNWVQITHRP